MAQHGLKALKMIEMTQETHGIKLFVLNLATFIGYLVPRYFWLEAGGLGQNLQKWP